MPLILGGIAFLDSDYSVPEKVPFGGKQTIAKHKLIGGYRVLDAMGVDDCDIKWSGRLQGAQATAKALAIDAMRQAGQPVSLTWDQFTYTVLIEEALFEFERPYQVLYRISCITQTSPGGPTNFASTLDGLVSSDLAMVTSLVSSFVSSVF